MKNIRVLCPVHCCDVTGNLSIESIEVKEYADDAIYKRGICVPCRVMHNLYSPANHPGHDGKLFAPFDGVVKNNSGGYLEIKSDDGIYAKMCIDGITLEGYNRKRNTNKESYYASYNELWSWFWQFRVQPMCCDGERISQGDVLWNLGSLEEVEDPANRAYKMSGTAIIKFGSDSDNIGNITYLWEGKEILVDRIEGAESSGSNMGSKKFPAPRKKEFISE